MTGASSETSTHAPFSQEPGVQVPHDSPQSGSGPHSRPLQSGVQVSLVQPLVSNPSQVLVQLRMPPEYPWERQVLDPSWDPSQSSPGSRTSLPHPGSTSVHCPSSLQVPALQLPQSTSQIGSVPHSRSAQRASHGCRGRSCGWSLQLTVAQSSVASTQTVRAFRRIVRIIR